LTQGSPGWTEGYQVTEGGGKQGEGG
jgi:hypothetical protein